jgi:hypothetical protein
MWIGNFEKLFAQSTTLGVGVLRQQEASQRSDHEERDEEMQPADQDLPHARELARAGERRPLRDGPRATPPGVGVHGPPFPRCRNVEIFAVDEECRRSPVVFDRHLEAVQARMKKGCDVDLVEIEVDLPIIEEDDRRSERPDSESRPFRALVE